MKNRLLFGAILIFMIAFFGLVLSFENLEKPAKTTQQIQISKKKMPADHHKFESLKQHFTSPQQVTEACLTCHNGRGNEIMENAHWNWLQTDTLPEKGIMQVGKKNVLNNFCDGTGSNEGLCMTCHIGYGWNNKDFDFKDPKNIDCLICHDNSGDYKKEKGKAGYPPQNLDLIKIAQNIGYPGNKNCGICHFYGGGGNNVKHGDLEKALLNCKREVDVHMNNETNMLCTDCHTTDNHNIKGNLYTVAANDNNRITCDQCHSGKPHTSTLLNNHFNKVACQTCHIPEYAKISPTKIFWDWSTAGKLKDGKYFEEATDELHKYDSGHGSSVYGKNLKPEYTWFNGEADFFLIEDTIKTDTLDLNILNNNLYHRKSKIYPVKVMRGKQIYDKKYKQLILPKLFGPKGSGAYWSDYDWHASAQKGMEYNGKTYSGEYGFIDTRSYWLINHMVAPAKEALSCTECHSKNGRLETLTGFYLPARDGSRILDTIGIFAIIGAILGVIIHAILRLKSKKTIEQ